MEKQLGQEWQRGVRHEGIQATAELFGIGAIRAEAEQLIVGRAQAEYSPVYHQERRDNARTALMEALTASGHLSQVEITGVSVDDIHHQVMSRLLNGWNDNLPLHEQKRRFAEICEELYIHKVHRAIINGLLPASTAVALISDFAIGLDSETATRLGYRVSNKKGMLRSTHLVQHIDGTYSRLIEQVSRSNGTRSSTFGFLYACGVHPGFGEADVAAMEIPLLYSTATYTDGVVDLMRRLDYHAGRDVLYGDRGDQAQQHLAYEDLRTGSAEREQRIDCYIDDLAALEEQLDALMDGGRISYEERMAIFKEEVDRILSAICTLDPSYAEATFGAAAAECFDQVAILMAAGRIEEAQRLLNDANHLKETVTFCGTSISLDKAKEMGLLVNEYGELVEKGSENWSWKQGICRVQSCPTRPGKTEVGPCSVCRKCQSVFDHGGDPTKHSPTLKQDKQPKVKAEKELVSA